MFQTENFPNQGAITTFKTTIETLELGVFLSTTFDWQNQRQNHEYKAPHRFTRFDFYTRCYPGRSVESSIMSDPVKVHHLLLLIPLWCQHYQFTQLFGYQSG
ncbi:hypothetical protein L6452_31281 [Arctium lappa]|uniref:Uncharacterized protein n=1 Tax=Arctium lappa TaxID=4217 RepID=A0ACB8ZLH2_ARCLA|nr:hypothetical protein L6452_31281 [Arctium lappa]